MFDTGNTHTTNISMIHINTGNDDNNHDNTNNQTIYNNNSFHHNNNNKITNITILTITRLLI